MSKISDYLNALREKKEGDEKQTVGELAVELMKKPAHLLKQFGIPPNCPSSNGLRQMG